MTTDDDYSRADRLYTNDARLERVTGANRVITSDHANIHAGEGFNAWVFAEGVADNGYVQVEFATTGSSGSYVHMKLMNAWAEGGIALFEALESPTLTTGATAFVPVNLRRTGTPAASVSVLKTNPTSISAGTVIRAYLIGGGGAGGGSGGSNDKDIELVLKPGATYLFRVQNLAGSAKALSLWLFWYEEGGA